MKIRAFFVGLAIGAVSVTIAAVFALYGRDLRWQRDAYEHYAGVYYIDTKSHTLKWMWFDEYARKQLLPSMKEKLHATPTPDPKWEQI